MVDAQPGPTPICMLPAFVAPAIFLAKPLAVRPTNTLTVSSQSQRCLLKNRGEVESGERGTVA